MKLAFIFNHSHEPTWSTPGGLSTSLKSLGNTVDHYDLKKPNEVLALSRAHEKYDAVCFWEAGTIVEEIAKIWHKDNFKHTLMLADSGDDPQIMKYNLGHTIPADVVLTPDFECNEVYHKLGKKSYWFTHWGDESTWQRSEQINSGIVSSTAGFRNGMWKDCMSLLVNKLQNKFVNPRLNKQEYISPEENSVLYSKSDIIVQVSSNKEITRRLFEASICERIVVADRLHANKNLDKCLIENEHIVLYSSPEECVEKVFWLLNNPKIRQKFSKQAYDHVSKNHSAKARAIQLLSIIKENL